MRRWRPYSRLRGISDLCSMIVSCDVLFTARLPRAALAARWTSRSGFWSRKRIGSRVSRSTSLTSVQSWLELVAAGEGRRRYLSL